MGKNHGIKEKVLQPFLIGKTVNKFVFCFSELRSF